MVDEVLVSNGVIGVIRGVLLTLIFREADEGLMIMGFGIFDDKERGLGG